VGRWERKRECLKGNLFSNSTVSFTYYSLDHFCQSVIIEPSKMSRRERPKKQVPVRSLSETAFKEICRQLEQAFTDEKASASFVCGGTIPMVEKLINVYWRNDKHDSQAQVVDLPVSSTDDDGKDSLVHQLVASCEAASFGRNKETVMDPEYRKAGKLELDQFATTFHPADYGILDEIAQNLVRNLDAGNAWLVPRRVEAEIYKLNVSCVVLFVRDLY
jgi:hypothetical protein